MTLRLLRVALTGGIATGKSYCAQRFIEWGIPVISADDIARDMVAHGQPAALAIGARFGPSVLHDDGSINRAALARIVFADSAALRDLEALIHPGVYEEIHAWMARQERDAPRFPEPPPFVMADVPLLFETRREKEFDCVVVAVCREDQQLARLVARGLTEADALQRIASQLPLRHKVRRADHVIDTSGTTAQTDERAREVWADLVERGQEPTTPGT